MKLPETARDFGIDPEAEYDAMFNMAAMRLSWISHLLAEKKTHSVVLSVSENHGVFSLSFIKELADPNLDRGSDPDSSEEDLEEFQLKAKKDVGPDELTIKMEDWIREAGIEKSLCMTCLLGIIDESTLDSFGIAATDVTVYIGTDKPIFMVYTFLTGKTREYIPPEANHTYHKKSERKAARNKAMFIEDDEEAVGEALHEVVVGNQKRERDEDGDGKEVNTEDKKAKLNPEDGDDIEDDEIVPEDGDDAEPK